MDESSMQTQYVASKLQTQKQLAFAEQKLQRRRNILQDDKIQLASAELELGIMQQQIKQKAAEEALAEAARKEEERRRLEKEKQLRDARENASRVMEDCKKQTIEAQIVFQQQRYIFEAALLEKKRLMQELHMTQNIETGVARQRQTRIHKILKQMEHRPKDQRQMQNGLKNKRR